MWHGSVKKAPISGAFFISALAALTLYLFSATASASNNCAPDRIDASVQVVYVYDGDTVRLSNGDRVRLVGINTPEMARDGHPAQAYSVEARNKLRQILLKNNNTLTLRYGVERHDRYHRLLAHAFLSDGRSISSMLLEQGFGIQLVVPPNLFNLDCYRKAEHRARDLHKGLWSLPEYQPVSTTRLDKSTRGYRIIGGKITRIGKGRKSLWLNLEGNVALRIDDKDLHYFSTLQPEHLKDRQIIARGWLYTFKDQLRMRVRHPAALEVLP